MAEHKIKRRKVAEPNAKKRKVHEEQAAEVFNSDQTVSKKLRGPSSEAENDLSSAEKKGRKRKRYFVRH